MPGTARNTRKAGIPFAEHDERYAYGTEWIGIVEALISGRRVTHEGRYFNIRDYQIGRRIHFARDSLIYVGGGIGARRRNSSRPMAVVWFINGQSLENVAALIAGVAGGRARARRSASVYRLS